MPRSSHLRGCGRRATPPARRRGSERAAEARVSSTTRRSLPARSRVGLAVRMVERGEREDEAADGLDRGPLTTRGLRVLVVDDHELILWGTRLLLCRLSWVQRCLQARDAGEALDLAG